MCKNSKTTGKAVLQCPLCSSVFYWKQALQEHVLLLHTEETRLKCDRCLLTFHHKRCFRTHVKKVGSKQNTLIYCSIPNCSQCASTCSDRAIPYQQQERHFSSSTAAADRQTTVNIKFEDIWDVDNNTKLIFQCQLCNFEGEGKQWALTHSAAHKTPVVV